MGDQHPLARFLALAAVLAWIVFFLAPALAPGRALLGVDLIQRFPPWDARVSSPPWEASNHLLFDQAVQFYPWRLASRQLTEAGLPPLWNPHAGTGSPLLANEQSATLAPVESLLGGIRPTRAPVAAAAIRLAVAGIGMLLLLSSLSVRPAAATFGALAFLGSGSVAILLYHPNSNVTMWLPLAAFLSWQLARDGRVRSAALLSLVLGAHLLGGHPETSLYVSLGSLLFFALGRWVTAGDRGGSHARRRAVASPLVRLILAHLVGALIAAPQILPFLEYLREGAVFYHRGEARFANAPACAIGILAPELYGTPDRPNTYFGPQNYHAMATQYAGLAAVILALWVTIRAWPRRATDPRRRALVLALAATAVLSVLLTYPTPVWRIAGWVPLFRVAANVTGLTLVFAFTVSVLGAIGLDEITLREREPKAVTGDRGDRSRILIAGVLVASLVALAAGLLLPLARERILAAGAERLAARHAAADYAQPIEVHLARLPLVYAALRATLVRTGLLGLSLAFLLYSGSRPRRPSAALALALLFHLTLDLAHFGRGYVPAIPESEVFPPTPETEELARGPGIRRVLPTGRAMPPNTLNAYGIEDFRVHDAVGSLSHARFEEAMSPAPFMRRPLASYDRALIDVAGIDVVAVDPREPVHPDTLAGFRLIERAAVTLLENERAWPRAFFVGAASEAADDSAATAAARELAQRARSDTVGAGTTVFVPGEIYLTPGEVGHGVASPRMWSIVRLLFPSVGGAPPPSLVREAPVYARLERGTRGEVKAEDRSPVRGASVPMGSEQPTVIEIGRLMHSPLVVTAEISAPGEGWLVLLDQDFRGWEVRVDRAPAQAARVSGLFRAVAIPPGRHTVSWQYRPASFALGLALALPALAFALVGIVAGGRRASRAGR